MRKVRGVTGLRLSRQLRPLLRARRWRRRWTGRWLWREFDFRLELDNVGAHLDLGDAEQDEIAAGLFDDQVSDGLRTARLHFSGRVEVVHRLSQSRGNDCDDAQQAESPASAQNVGPDEMKIVACQPNGGFLVYLEGRWPGWSTHQ